MKNVLFLVCVIIVATVTGLGISHLILRLTITKASVSRPAVEWIGKLTVADDSDKYMPRGVGWLPNVQLGIRADGVLVWRGVTNQVAKP